MAISSLFGASDDWYDQPSKTLATPVDSILEQL
jgi:hypothetical protein